MLGNATRTFLSGSAARQGAVTADANQQKNSKLAQANENNHEWIAVSICTFLGVLNSMAA
jgi:hypothetical protein